MRDQHDATALFREVTGRDPAGVWSSPGRVNLIGEHTDYNEGFVLPFALPHRTYAAAGIRSDGAVRVVSALGGEPVEMPVDRLDADLRRGEAEVPDWARYPLGVAWAAVHHTGADASRLPGIDLAFASDVPVGAGLSSSAAIEGATGVALRELWGLPLEPLELARIGRAAENDIVGAPTGIMDQVASILGREDSATLIDCRSLDVQVVPLGFAQQELEILVIDTRVTHAHSSGGYRDRRDACERGAAAMGVPALRDLTAGDLPRAREAMDEVAFRRVRHIVTENDRVRETVRLLHEDGPRAIGAQLIASHASMRDDFEISVPELDTAVEAAAAAGAIGARMTGGGFGGAAIALVDTARAETIAGAVSEAFDRRSYASPRIFPVSPAAGARRDA